MYTKVGVKESQTTEEAGKEPSPDPSENLDPDQICVLAPCLQNHANNHVCKPPNSVMAAPAHCAVYKLYFLKVTSVLLKKKSRAQMDENATANHGLLSVACESPLGAPEKKAKPCNLKSLEFTSPWTCF